MKPESKPAVTHDPRQAVGMLLLACLLLAAEASSLRAQVVLNEIMAINASTLPNENNFPDWIELYNTSASPVNLAGMSLTDTNLQPRRFVFPPNTFISGRGYLIVWCDNETSAPGLHTGFRLDGSGETVYLFATDGLTVRDSVTFGMQVADLSIGRVPSGTGPWQLTRPTPLFDNAAQPLGARLALRLNEWAATNSTGGGDDWLELYNPETLPVALTGLTISDELPPLRTRFAAFTNLSFIAGDGFIEFICDSEPSPADHLNFRLSNTDGEPNLTLYDTDRVSVIDRVSFPGNSTVPGYWQPNISYGRLPDAAPGTNYFRFPSDKTTPGASNFLPITNAVINEILAHTDLPLEDAIELWNSTTTSVDISYWWLSNQKNTPKKFRIPANTVIPPGQFVVFYEQVGGANGFNTSGTGDGTNFTLNSAHGDGVYLFTALNDAAGTLTGFRRGLDFGSSANGVSFGRYVTSTGEPDITPMSLRSFGVDNPATVAQFRQGKGVTNPYPAVGPLVITEIMYHPPDVGGNDNSQDEYVEIYNTATTNVTLFDPTPVYFAPGVGIYASGLTNTWRVRGGIEFNFPTDVALAPGHALLLVNFSPTEAALAAAFRNKYAVPSGVPLFGPYDGKLSNKSASLELYRADAPQGPQHPDFRFVPYMLSEKVKYSDTAPWPTASDGSGAALHRRLPELYGNEPTNWVSSAPTPGRSPPIRLGPSQWVGSNFVVRFEGWAGGSYTVQYAGQLEAAQWSLLVSLPPRPASGLVEVSDPAAAHSPRRFYRIVTDAQQ